MSVGGAGRAMDCRLVSSVDGIVIVSIQSAKLGHTNRRRTLLTLSRTRGHLFDCSVGTFDQCNSHQPSPLELGHKGRLG